MAWSLRKSILCNSNLKSSTLLATAKAGIPREKNSTPSGFVTGALEFTPLHGMTLIFNPLRGCGFRGAVLTPLHGVIFAFNPFGVAF